MTPTGVIATHGTDRWWAWAASRVVPVAANPRDGRDGPKRRAAPTGPATTVHNVHSGSAHTVVQAGVVHGDVHVHDGGRTTPVPDDSGWLRSCWAPLAEVEAAIEMRYLTRPGDSGLDGFLIVRAPGRDRGEAEHRVAALRARLGVLPSRVTAAPVTEEAETRGILTPFRPHGEGVVEVRKRLTVQRTNRDDAHHPWLTAVTPFGTEHRPWDPLWTELATLPFHAMLSVGLAPYAVGPGLRSHLAARAADLARLAGQGPPPTGVWSVPRPPDEFARTAHELISDAIRRYTDRAFVIRVSLAAERPIPSFLAELVATTISAPTANHGFAAAAPVVVRPGPVDLPTAWSNITALNFAPWSADTRGGPAEAIGDLERVLGTIVDVDEAAAAFRLPYRT
ncbi:MAG TPA: hypothetical protein VGX25_25280 [Actinophytocola sp.]|uniref:hypothetical protein n=1 Tax=Actinophytocola sp. TaxID=1872138 RepID=UPI002DDDB5F2|nr:hypothetical protein [Actinophytocola sp.]HEV2782718.1 hypothetical protein [Actinophytocola sp.]